MRYSFPLVLFLMGLLSSSQIRTTALEKPLLIVYGVEDCHYCHDSRALLDKHNVKYVFYNIDENTEKRKEMVKGLKAASIDISNLNMPVIKKSDAYLVNDGDFDKFLQQLIQFAKDDVSKS